ncbi:MAG: hypothetical protein WDN45_11310 [Caulobacteraceae bacterium]
MAVLMGLGVIGVLWAKEPQQADAVLRAKAPLWTPRGFADAVAGPFIAFFRVYGPLALLMLAFITLYRVPEYVIGPDDQPVLSRPGPVQGPDRHGARHGGADRHLRRHRGRRADHGQVRSLQGPSSPARSCRAWRKPPFA